MLVDEEVITSEQLERALKEQKKTKEFICSTLIRLGFASEERILGVLAQQLDCRYVKIKDAVITPDVIAKIPAKYASHYKMMPLKIENNVLICAVSDPLNVQVLDDIKLLLGF